MNLFIWDSLILGNTTGKVASFKFTRVCRYMLTAFSGKASDKSLSIGEKQQMWKKTGTSICVLSRFCTECAQYYIDEFKTTYVF